MAACGGCHCKLTPGGLNPTPFVVGDVGFGWGRATQGEEQSTAATLSAMLSRGEEPRAPLPRSCVEAIW